MNTTNGMVLETIFPRTLFALRSTSASIVVPVGPDVRVYGEVEIELFGHSFRKTLSAGQALLAGPEKDRIRKLLECRPVRIQEDVLVRANGPSLLIRRWQFSKASDQETELVFDHFSIWSCSDDLGERVPRQHPFELLLPGIGVTGDPPGLPGTAVKVSNARTVDADGGQATTNWLQSLDGVGRLVKEGGDWYVERNCRLYPSPGLSGQAGLTFEATRGNTFLPLTIYVNYMKRAATRVRLQVDATGVPLALELDAPSAPRGTYLLCLQLSPNYPLRVDMSGGIHGKLPLERVRIEPGGVRAFVHPSIRTGLGFERCASWSTPGARMEFTAALPRQGHDTRACRSVTFGSRRDGTASPLDDPRFDGLRIAGLDSIARPSEVLEAQDLRVEVLLKAGQQQDPAAPLVALSCGWLGPRPGQRSHDDQMGVLDMLVKDALLQVPRQNAPAPFVYRLVAREEKGQDVWEGSLAIGPTATLLVPPFGGAASVPDATEADWPRSVRMTLPPGAQLTASQSSAAPRLLLAREWSAAWRLGGEQGLALHELANLATTFKEISFQGPAKTAAAAEGNETLAYATLAVALAYVGGAYEGQGWDKFFETELRLKLDEQALKAWAERNALQDLVVTLGALTTSQDQQAWFRRFVEENLEKPTGPRPVKGALWPFAAALGIPLYEVDASGGTRWLWDIERAGRKLKCGFAFDYSRESTFTPQKLDPTLPADFLTSEPKKRPALWPRSRQSAPGMMPGAVEDPARPVWSGIFIRDVPLAIAADLPTGAKFFLKLRDAINQRLRLDYGWLDAHGHTWVAEWKGDPVRLYPLDDAPTPPVEIRLIGFETQGGQGQAVSSGLEIDVILHAIVDDATGQPVALAGKAEFAMVSGQSSFFELKPKDGTAIRTKSLPGFDSLAFNRFRTDFRSASLEVALVPSAQLRQAIPFFEQSELLASLAVPLDGEGEPTLALRLPAEAPTRLFGKWGIGIRSIEFAFGNLNRTRVHFALDLGIPGISRAAGCVEVSTADGDLQFHVHLDSIAVNLSLFGVQVQGELQWRAPGHQASDSANPAPVKLSDAAGRDFYGAVRLTGLANSREAGVYLRIGSTGRPFWIAALMIGHDPEVVGKGVKDTRFLLAYGAQRISGDVLRQALANPGASLPGGLFPERGKDPVAWLDSWQRATDGLGLAVGLTGNFTLDGFLASAPDGGDNLSVLWADSGLFYASSRLKIFGVHPTEFHLLIDFTQQLLSAGVQLGGLPLGGGVEVSAGYLSATLAWGSERTGFGFSLGYPPVMNDADLGMPVLDWSKAVSVHVKGAWPVNTYQGGMKAWYFTKPRRYGFGVAVRVGYSNSWKVTGSSIADARADVGVMVGGSFQFCREDLRPEQPPELLLEAVPMSADERWLLDAAAEVLALATRDDMLISASIFGDLWGHASVVFMGVTIAGVKIDARAAFDVNGKLSEGILYMGAEYSFRVSVKIGCSSYSTRCHFRIVMINRGSAQAGQCNAFLRDVRERLLALETEAA